MIGDAIRLARERAGSARVEVIVIDSGMSEVARGRMRAAAPDVMIERIGAGSSEARHEGMMASRGRIVATIDAHVVMSEGWADALLAAYRDRPEMARGVACALCGGIDYDRRTMRWSEIAGAGAAYHRGARIAYLVEARGRFERRCLVGKWCDRAEPGERIGCVMGAFYAMRRDWYEEIGRPWRLNKSWGCDEEIVSIASYLAGGAAWLLPESVRVWHAFDLPDNKYDAQCLLQVRRNRANLMMYFPFTAEEREQMRIWAWNYVPADPMSGEQRAFAEMWAGRREALEAYLRERCDGWPVPKDAAAGREDGGAPREEEDEAERFRDDLARIVSRRRDAPQRLAARSVDVCDRCGAEDSFRVVGSDGRVSRLRCGVCGRTATRVRR